MHDRDVYRPMCLFAHVFGLLVLFEFLRMRKFVGVSRQSREKMFMKTRLIVLPHGFNSFILVL